MRNKFGIALVAIFASLGATHAPSASAQSCEAYFPFDGSLADASGHGFDGRMIGQNGAAATPRFVEGRSGQALAFDGTAAMRAFMDLNYESCPQVSFTAWIRFDGPVLRENQVILATGGSGPGLRATGSILALNGTENGIWVQEAVYADSGWMFVAGVYDYAENTYALHWRNRSVEGTLSEHRRLPADAVWVGAMNENLTQPASNVVIDELRIVGRALDAEAIKAMRDGSAAADPVQFASVGAGGGACASHDGCPADMYCALDGTCHPESHRPMALGSESKSTSGSREIVTADVRDSLQETIEERQPIEFGYESEEEGVAAAEAAAERHEAERQAQEDAAAEDAAAAGASEEAQAAVPRPTGPSRFSAVAGTSGDGQSIIDLENEFLHKIQWQERDGAPCSIWVWGTSAENLRSLNWCASGFGPADQGVFVGLPSNVISAIEVCQRDSNQVLKGLRVVGTAVNPDGTLVYVPAVSDQALPNCEKWSPRVLCPADHVGTGIVVHSRERQVGDGRVIIGLQLVCRAVTMQGG